jgi:hypothetical protein
MANHTRARNYRLQNAKKNRKIKMFKEKTGEQNMNGIEYP